jgi:predicted outer membrane repeat protein
MRCYIHLALLFLLSNSLFAGNIVVSTTQNDGVGSLRTAVQNATEGDTISFNPNLLAIGNATIELSSPIYATQGLTFMGLKTATDTLFISGKDSFQLFNFNLSSSITKKVEFNNMSLTKGETSLSGGAIYFTQGNDLIISNCYLRNNHANYGGAVYANTRKGDTTLNLLITNTVVTQNTATSAGGGIYCINWDNINLNLSHCTITGNTRSSISLLNAYDSDYKPTKDSYITVTNSVLTHNSGEYGGGIKIGSSTSHPKYYRVSIRNTAIKENIAEKSGGGIYCLTPRVTYDIARSSISKNSAQYAAGIFSSIRTDIETHIDSCLLDSNIATSGSGGAIYFSSSEKISPKLTINASKFRGNRATYSGGGIYLSHGYSSTPVVSITNSQFISNSADEQFGGGLYYKYDFESDALLHIDNCRFSGNSSKIGGAIVMYPASSTNRATATLNLFNSTLDNNSADEGGGISVGTSNFNAISPRSYLNIVNSTITKNFAKYGGGISSGYIPDPTFYSSYIDIKNSTITENTAQISGSAIYSQGGYASEIKITSSILAHNSGLSEIFNAKAQTINSLGYNVFGASMINGSVTSDQLGILSTQLKLESLDATDGETFTMLPGPWSVAIDRGNPLDSSAAQNRSLLGIRDVGASERTCIVRIDNAIVSCGSYTSLNGSMYTENAEYQDSILSTTSCDSIISVYLTLNNQTINDTACLFYISPTGKSYLKSGEYRDTLLNASVLGCDSFLTTNLYLTTIDTALRFEHPGEGPQLYSQEDDIRYQWIQCDNDSILRGDTTKNFSPDGNGTYAVILYKNGCVDTSECLNISTASISPIAHPTVSIVPNPSSTRVVIRAGNHVIFSLSVVDCHGKVVLQRESNKSSIELDITSLTSGLYRVRVHTSAGTFYSKLVKQ